MITSAKKPIESTSDDEEEPPILMNHDLPTLGAVLETSDVLLEVLDARDPLPFRSTYLEKVMEGKKVLLVLNKIGEPADSIEDCPILRCLLNILNFSRYVPARGSVRLVDVSSARAPDILVPVGDGVFTGDY